PGDEGEVEAVGCEYRVAVGEPTVGHVDDLTVLARGDETLIPPRPPRGATYPRQPDAGQRPRAGLGPGQPGRVRRPGQPADHAVVGRGQLGDLPGRHVHDQQPAVVRCGRDGGSVRRGGQADHVAELARGQPDRLDAGFAGYRADLQGVGAVP